MNPEIAQFKQDLQCVDITQQDCLAQMHALINDFSQNLKQEFLAEPQHNVVGLLRKRSAAVDALLMHLWSGHKLNLSNWALIPVGGYGRRELFLHSDVDILLLQGSTSHKSEAAEFIRQIWDLGLRPGHSIRSLKECAELAQNDASVLTSLSETRLLAGSRHLYNEFRECFNTAFNDPVQYYTDKRAEQHARHQQHDNTEYNLQPDIKNSPGALRDLQNLEWVALRSLGERRGLAGLVEGGHLTRREYRDIVTARKHLWQIRYALHCIVDKPQERLLFEHQLQVAELLGYSADSNEKGVEHFMRHYFRTVLGVSGLSHYLMQYYNERLLGSTPLRRSRLINHRFRRVGSAIDVIDGDIFATQPEAMLELFYLLGSRNDIGDISARTIRLLRQHRHLLRQDSNPQKARRYFMGLMNCHETLSVQLKRMWRYGILQAWLPEFAAIEGMTQFDLYHIYTIDAHTLRVIEHIQALLLPQASTTMPDVHSVFWNLPQIDLLYIAGLFHDIGKGRGGNHSELGAVDVGLFAERMGMDKWARDLLEFLVRNHLYMSTTAQRHDLSNPEVINEFCQKVNSLLALDYLYVLTVTDIIATNPKLWNNWRASLLNELYLKARNQLRQHVMLKPPSSRLDTVRSHKRTVLRLLNRKYPKPQIRELWAQLGDTYFLRTPPDVIYWQNLGMLERSDLETPLVLVGMLGPTTTKICRIFVYSPYHPWRFAQTVTALAQLNLNALDASLITAEDQRHTLSTYVVQTPDGKAVEEERFNEITRHISKAIQQKSKPKTINMRIPEHFKHFPHIGRVSLKDEPDNFWTLQVRCLDKPGVLAHIGQVFMEEGLHLADARIITLGERVEDLFTLNGALSRNDLQDKDYRQYLCVMLEKRINPQIQ